MFISRHTILPGTILDHPSAHIMIISIVLLHTVTMAELPLLIHSFLEESHMDEGYLDVVALVKTQSRTFRKSTLFACDRESWFRHVLDSQIYLASRAYVRMRGINSQSGSCTEV